MTNYKYIKPPPPKRNTPPSKRFEVQKKVRELLRGFSLTFFQHPDKTVTAESEDGTAYLVHRDGWKKLRGRS